MKNDEENLLADREKFEGIVKNLLQGEPLKRSKLKVAKRKARDVNPAPEVEQFW